MASPLSGTTGRNAGIWTAQYLGGQRDEINKLFDQGMAGAGAAFDEARGYLGQGRDAVSAGATAAGDAYGQISDLFRPEYERGNQAGAMVANSLGLNGAGGNDIALNTFRAGPGYEWRRDQSVDAAARKMGALGLAGSGNTLSALTTLGGNLADQEFGGWQDRLFAQSGRGMQAAQGMAGGLQGLAQTRMAEGGALADLFRGDAAISGREAGLATQDASQRAALQMQIANQIAGAGQKAMLAGQDAATNRMNLTMQGVKLGTDLLGKALSGGFGLPMGLPA